MLERGPKRLAKKAKRGFRGYPVALYGPDDVTATKIVVGIVPAEGAETSELRRWLSKGLPQDWGSGGDCHLRVRVVGWLELLSEAGTERAIVDGAPNLQQQVGAAPRPAHLL